MNEFRYVKSSYSGPAGSGSCVEIALNVREVRAIRDSKDPRGAHLTFAPATLAAFLGAVKTGSLDRR